MDFLLHCLLDQYVEAARAVGVPSGRLALGHVLPNVIAPVVVMATLDMGALLLSISALSFLGLGAHAQRRPAVHADGAPLDDFPGLAIFLTVMALNLLGDGLPDVLDPKSRGGH